MDYVALTDWTNFFVIVVQESGRLPISIHHFVNHCPFREADVKITRVRSFLGICHKNLAFIWRGSLADIFCPDGTCSNIYLADRSLIIFDPNSLTKRGRTHIQKRCANSEGPFGIKFTSNIREWVHGLSRFYICNFLLTDFYPLFKKSVKRGCNLNEQNGGGSGQLFEK